MTEPELDQLQSSAGIGNVSERTVRVVFVTAEAADTTPQPGSNLASRGAGKETKNTLRAVFSA